MTVSSNQYSAVPSYAGGLKLGLDKVFDTSWDNQGGFQFEDVTNMDTTEDAFVDDFQYQMPSEVAFAEEGSPFPRINIDPVRHKRHTVVTCKAEIKITREAAADLKYQPLKDGAKGAGIAMHRTIEKTGTKNIGNGFGSVLSSDGVSVYNTLHSLAVPLPGKASTMSNRSRLKLNSVNLGLRRTAGRQQLDEHGDLSPCKFNQLIVCSDLEYTANQLVESTEVPENANNAKNVTSRGLKVYVLDYLFECEQFAQSMWILRDSALAMNRFIWRQKPSKDIVKEPNGDLCYQIYSRFAYGWSHHNGVDGNTGEL